MRGGQVGCQTKGGGKGTWVSDTCRVSHRGLANGSELPVVKGGGVEGGQAGEGGGSLGLPELLGGVIHGLSTDGPDGPGGDSGASGAAAGGGLTRCLHRCVHFWGRNNLRWQGGRRAQAEGVSIVRCP